MRLYYDFHIHTGLSPCGSDDMTPNNIVNMALLKELDCIAITDHNSCKNVRAVIDAAGRIDPRFIVIPGMEAETSEEIHTVCLFPDCDAAESFGEFIYGNLPDIQNEPEIFGRQILFDGCDEEIGTENKLLLHATEVDLYTMVKKAREYGGICIPAHIDRPAYGILATLGFIPPDLDINMIEISRYNEPQKFIAENKRLIGRAFPFLQSSDAHNLWDIAEKVRFLEMERGSESERECRTAGEIVAFLRNIQ